RCGKKGYSRDKKFTWIRIKRGTYLCFYCTVNASCHHGRHCHDYWLWWHTCCKRNNVYRLPCCLFALPFPNHYAYYYFCHVFHSITKSKRGDRTDYFYT